ncbi:hypothetical protein [Methylobacterium dankookense]|jgi:hypothetical protein|uniref:Uncharacterized protein n=1 Tax=Methylobacterium dankookense TaxID=560405 RepID=A0A564G3U3_9HYPH|nr:hypothetical protein [Methylobacterium dankookense]GJD59055.1 hypothetical protein IFDJLNFL_4981 [Methylobacterium dankookense]VUF14724.1 hypothetical protein MTDSW087_04449 [Methylobacterium dankookense]
MTAKTLRAPLLALALVAGALSAAQAQQGNNVTPGAPAGDSGGNATTGSSAAPSGK